MAKKEDLTKMEDKLHNAIRENKKTLDSTINGLINRLSKLEKEADAFNKEKEAWKKEKEEWEMERAKERDEWKIEDNLTEQMAMLKASIASLTPEEGEINNDTLVPLYFPGIYLHNYGCCGVLYCY